MVTAYIGIGSNMGDRQKNIERAIEYLRNSEDIKVSKVSTVYETNPVGGLPQGKFLNGVIELKTNLAPLDLLDRLNKIESKLGRKRFEKNGPRVMDLDILLYGDIKMFDRRLTIPHPRMYGREFVLRGLREIAPELVEG